MNTRKYFISNRLYIHHPYNNQLHNKFGPAYIHYNNNGEVCYKHYYEYNKFHNTKVPAEISSGFYTKKYNKYYLNGKEIYNIKSQKEFKRYLKLCNLS